MQRDGKQHGQDPDRAGVHPINEGDQSGAYPYGLGIKIDFAQQRNIDGVSIIGGAAGLACRDWLRRNGWLRGGGDTRRQPGDDANAPVSAAIFAHCSMVLLICTAISSV